MHENIKSAVPALSVEERKKALIAQGALQRNNVDIALGIVRTNLQPERLARTAVNRLGSAASSAVGNLFDWNTLRRGDVSKLLPLAMSAYTIINKRNLVMPILRGTGVVAAVSAGAWFVWRYKHHAKRRATLRTQREVVLSDS